MWDLDLLAVAHVCSFTVTQGNCYRPTNRRRVGPKFSGAAPATLREERSYNLGSLVCVVNKDAYSDGEREIGGVAEDSVSKLIPL